MQDAIELAAEQSCLANDSYNNPYPLYSDEFNRYERGWTQAQKKVDAGLFTKQRGKQKNEFRLLYPRESEPVYHPPRDPNIADKYKNRKG